jgi:mevalonate pyrophosphate decarboxylase
VVTSLQVAILLNPFKASISLEATADTTSTIGAVFKKDEKDDDVWYDPKKNPTNKLQRYNVDKLGELELQSLSHVAFRTVLKDVVKHI